jgi:hypothetical protein
MLFKVAQIMMGSNVYFNISIKDFDKLHNIIRNNCPEDYQDITLNLHNEDLVFLLHLIHAVIENPTVDRVLLRHLQVGEEGLVAFALDLSSLENKVQKSPPVKIQA